MKVYLCNECGYSGLPIGMEKDDVYFLGCPSCKTEFKNMRLLGEFVDDQFVPKED